MFLATITNLFTAIGWALLNSIWQMGLLYLLAHFTTKFIFKSAAARHTAFTAALITGFGWFVCNLFTTPQAIFNFTTTNYQLATSWKNIVASFNSTLPYLTIVYLIWVSVCLFRLTYIYTTNLNQQKNNWQKLPAQWRLFIQQHSQHLGIKKTINAFISNYIDTPQVIGILKPVILIPASCITYLSPQQLEAVLLHEIAHIKRNDFALNVFIIVVEILFFFNPFARKLTNVIRKEREYSCDDWVLQFQYQPTLYATALLQLEKNRCNQQLLGIAANNGNQQQLLQRVKRMAGLPLPVTHSKPAFISSIIVLLVAALFLLNPVTQTTQTAGVAQTIIPVTVNYVSDDANTAFATTSFKPLTQTPAVNESLTRSAELELLMPLNTEADFNPAFVNNMEEEMVDYSLEEPITEIPDEVLNKLSEAPFVPSSSFNYQYIEDTLLPDQEKNLLIAETEALHNAHIALEKVQWEAVAKQLKLSDVKVKQLKELVLKELAQADIEHTRQALVQQQAKAVTMTKNYRQQQLLTNQYRQQQALLENLQNKMRQEQQQLERLKDKQQSDLKQLESEQQKLQQTARKKRIIYI